MRSVNSTYGATRRVSRSAITAGPMGRRCIDMPILGTLRRSGTPSHQHTNLISDLDRETSRIPVRKARADRPSPYTKLGGTSPMTGPFVAPKLLGGQPTLGTGRSLLMVLTALRPNDQSGITIHATCPPTAWRYRLHTNSFDCRSPAATSHGTTWKRMSDETLKAQRGGGVLCDARRTRAAPIHGGRRTPTPPVTSLHGGSVPP